MTNDEKLLAIETKVDILLGRALAEEERRAASDKHNPFKLAAAGGKWTPAIPNTIDQVPRVGDIRAEKLARIKLPDGREFWAAIIQADNGDFYNEVTPFRAGDCKAVAGAFGLGFSFEPVPAGIQYLRKELGEWYLEKRPAPGCRVVKGSWKMEKIA